MKHLKYKFLTGLVLSVHIVQGSVVVEMQQACSLPVGVFALQGKRQTMEDAHFIKENCWGLFDGHGGAKVAEFAAKNFPGFITLEQATTPDDVVSDLKLAFDKVQNGLGSYAFQQGATALIIALHGNTLVVANAGDSRAVLCRNGQAVALTEDHKPNRPDEQARIEALGGHVVNIYGIDRIEGNLSVSRALGDRYWQPLVTYEPEIFCIPLDPDDQFVIQGCDGLWDVYQNQQAVNMVKASLSQSPGDFSKAALTLARAALALGSTDNITVMVIGLAAASDVYQDSLALSDGSLTDID